MESCIQISLSEYIDPDQSQLIDHLGSNESHSQWPEPVQGFVWLPCQQVEGCLVCLWGLQGRSPTLLEEACQV